MKVSFSMISDELKKFNAYIKGFSIDDDLIYEQIFFLNHKNFFQNGKVYISNNSNLPKNPHFSGRSMIISIGEPPQEYLFKKCDFIVLKENVTVDEVINIVQELIYKYSKWYDEMNIAILEEKSIQFLFDSTSLLLDNPIYFHDKNYNLIAFSQNLNIPGMTDHYQLEICDKLPTEMVNELKNSRDFQNTFKTTSATFHNGYEDYYNSYNHIYNNIRLNNEYCGRIFVDERLRDFRESDYAVINILSKTVEVAIKKNNLLFNNISNSLDNYLVQILDGNDTNYSIVNKEFEKLSCSNENNYSCIQLKMSDNDILFFTLVSQCEMIKSNLENCYSFIYNSNIIIITWTENDSKREASFYNKLTSVLKSLNVHAGISMDFKDFSELRLCYTQTNISYKIGFKNNPNKFLYQFEDILIDYILENFIEEFPKESFYPKALSKLIQYDKKHNTNYTITLKTYLENDCKHVKVMEKLFIHRSTLLYRFNRIREIIDIDFESVDIKLHFLLAFRLMDINIIEDLT